MQTKTHKIRWTQKTWNPITGCTMISRGCQNCYVFAMAKRLKGKGVAGYENGFTPTIHMNRLGEPFSWKTPGRVFVCSMADIFHEDLQEAGILRVFEVMAQCPRHTFQVLTKRPERLLELNEKINWTPNIWMGVTIEAPQYLHRKEKLIHCSAKIKWLSVEPLIERLVGFDPTGLHWVVVGGEIAPTPRLMDLDWAREIRDACLKKGVPFFYKQKGGKISEKESKNNLLDGQVWEQYPAESTETR